MNDEFASTWIRSDYSCEWSCWLGMPMMYDFGLCVNRTREEHDVSDTLRYKGNLEI